MDAATGSFGFRGEALGSISDVSLLEIVTKTQGRPNGYRKVMKAWTLLYCSHLSTLKQLLDIFASSHSSSVLVDFLIILFRAANVCILELMMIGKMWAQQVIHS